MQQKVCTRNTALFVKNGQVCGAGAPPQYPFRCPRCGEHERFQSLASLRAHLEYSHPFQTKHDISLLYTRDHCNTDHMKGCKSSNSDMHKVRDAGTNTNSNSNGRGEHKLMTPEMCPDQKRTSPERSINVGATSAGVGPLSAPVVSVEKRLEGMMRTANSSMERRLLRLSSELAQTDTAILCERAHSHHLAQEKQEVLERERALSRQVDAAVMVIATLKQQLSISEHELERREQEVITIQKFLEAAAQHEMCGKVRLRRFIEGLLRRISLAERLLEYYQSAPHRHCCTAHPVPMSSELGPQRITQSRSSGEYFEQDEEQQLHGQSGWGLSKATGGRLGYESWHQRRRSDGYEV
ncbi:protein ZNF365 isoform X1 [Myxocyprinus asiaticus]|uniref:protein ZNF365 isoform X1 n=1 Tax=Myxocyprinus asiaticus TaxID=70543 RepID=UPI0022239F6A|nr:protein ZNF365 isoform X1 [Myxocyprinus asiaticus]XP_051502816.1 protein ZNF365 isoform X1 [Myxocyprinus asiaticus]